MVSETDILRLYNPTTECGDGRCRDLFHEFLYCVIIPCSVVALICLIIALVACCRSKACRCKKYTALNAQPSAMELEDYNSVRRASLTLRQMSRNRETPMMGSRAGSMTLVRSQRRNARNRNSCSSAPGTLQRQHRNRRADRTHSPLEAPPPPYIDGGDGSVNGFSVQEKSRRSYDEDALSPPPPPPYRSQEDDVFMHPSFLQVSMHSSVTYDDNSDTNGSGAQPLLSHHHHPHHRSGQHSNMSYSSHSQW